MHGKTFINYLKYKEIDCIQLAELDKARIFNQESWDRILEPSLFFYQDLSYLNETKTSKEWSLTFLLDLTLKTLNEMKG